MKKRNILVTSALPYANGPIHLGHLVEYIQTDIWVRFQNLIGNNCYYMCADDTHGTPIMLSAKKQNISPEELINKMNQDHQDDFKSFLIQFDHYYTTNSEENRVLAEFSGKSGLLIEGPSARGKDWVLRLFLDQLNLKYYEFTVGLDIDKLIPVINKAKQKGAILILPEMNALPSKILEGILNAILTGEATPGFFCFCTINPCYFEGKERLSSALLNRFNLVKLPEYSPAELQAIIQKRATLPDGSLLLSKPDLDRMIAYHHSIQAQLSQKPRAPQVTLRELLWVIDDLKSGNREPLSKLMSDQYYVYNLFLDSPLSFESDNDRTQLPAEDLGPHIARNIIDLAIPGQSVTLQISTDCPSRGHYNPDTRTITIRYPVGKHSVETQLLHQIKKLKNATRRKKTAPQVSAPPSARSKAEATAGAAVEAAFGAAAPATVKPRATKTKAHVSSGLVVKSSVPDRIIGHTTMDDTAQYFPKKVGYDTDNRGVPLMESLSQNELGDASCDCYSQTITLNRPPMFKRKGRHSVVDLALLRKQFPKNIQIQGSGIRSFQLIFEDGHWRLKIKSKRFRKCRINTLIYDVYGPSDPTLTPEEKEAFHSKKFPLRIPIDYKLGPDGAPNIKPLVDEIRISNPQSPPEITSAIRKIEWWFNENITYSKSKQTKQFWKKIYDSDANVVDALLESRAGVCFESANAMMGIVKKLFPDLPVRVADGPVGQNGKIKKIAGHRWVEVFFDDKEWVSFDPTGVHCDAETRELLKKEKSAILDFLDEKKQEFDQRRQQLTPPFRTVQVKKPGAPTQAGKTPRFLKESFPLLKYLPLSNFQSELRKRIPLRYPELFSQSVNQEDRTYYTYDEGQLDPARLIRGLPPFGKQKGGVTFEPQTLIISDYPFAPIDGSLIDNQFKKELYFWEQLMALGFTIKIWTGFGPVSINNIEELAGTLQYASPPTAEMQQHYLESGSDVHAKFLTSDDMAVLRDKIQKEFSPEPEPKFEPKFKYQHQCLERGQYTTKVLTARDGTTCFIQEKHWFSKSNPCVKLEIVDATGKQKWVKKMSVYSSAYIGPDGTVYILSSCNLLTAYNSNGNAKWSMDADDFVHVNDETVYIMNQKSLLALNPIDGSIRWQVRGLEKSKYIFDVGPDGTVYANDINTRCLCALNNMESGTAHPAWRNIFPQLRPVSMVRLLFGSDGTIYMNKYSHKFDCIVVLAITPDEGHIKWKVPLVTSEWYPSIAGSNGMIYFEPTYDPHAEYNDYKDHIYILDSTGNYRLWTPPPNLRFLSIGDNGTIYVVSDHQKVTALNPDNTVRWNLCTKSKIKKRVVTGSDGRIYVSCEDGVEVYEEKEVIPE